MADPNPNFTDSPDSFRPPALDESGAVRDKLDPPPSTGLTPEERQWAMFCHLSAIVAAALSTISVLGPIICWMVKKDTSKFVDRHGKEAVNFQISMLIYNVVAAIFCLVLIGFAFLAVLWILNTIFVIIAAIQASDGKFYRYPMTIRFIQ